MGYGKTTAAMDYFHDRAANYVWLSVERYESSSQFIWYSLVKQISKSIPELGNHLRTLGFPNDASQRERILQIIEDFVHKTDIVLVIDDYHFAHVPELDMLLEQIVWSNIKGFHILIISRTMPEMNIDELMLKGYCYLIKNRLFEVSQTEVIEFFKLHNHTTSDEIAKEIYEITEGWFSAVYLLMQRYVETGSIDPDESMEMLIETAVMARYSDREAYILVSLCILDSFTSQQAVYVTGYKNTERTIRKISRENSFIRYDRRSQVYRIHNILRIYLYQLLNNHYSPAEVKDIYRRAGEWCIKNGDMLVGIKHLQKANDFDGILLAFENPLTNLFFGDNYKFVMDMFDRIPEETKYRHPIGYLSYVCIYTTDINMAEGARLLTKIEDHYESETDLDPEMKRRIWGEIELIRSYVEFNHAEAMFNKMKSAYTALAGRSSIAHRNKVISFGSPHSMYLFYREKGKLESTMSCLINMFPYYSEMADGCGKGIENILQAECCLETGKYDEAERHANKAIYKASTINELSVMICANMTLARIYAVKGKYEEVLDIIKKFNPIVEACGLSLLMSAWDISCGYIAGIMGRKDKFSNRLISGDWNKSYRTYQGLGFYYIVYGKYLLLHMDFLRLEVLCEEMRQTFSVFHNQLGFIHAYIQEAIAKQHLYGIHEAKTCLLNAIEIGMADNLVLPFAEYGVHILEILNALHKDFRTDVYLTSLLTHATKYCDNQRTLVNTPREAPLLTDREMDVLKLVVEGKNNKEIAGSLFLAEVTVRKNITSIYRKLNVSGRASAVKKTLDLNIL